jgi:hypothetical protein
MCWTGCRTCERILEHLGSESAVPGEWLWERERMNPIFCQRVVTSVSLSEAGGSRGSASACSSAEARN